MQKLYHICIIDSLGLTTTHIENDEEVKRLWIVITHKKDGQTMRSPLIF